MIRAKDDVQREAREALQDNNHWGLIAMCTGAGKSKIAVDESIEVAKLNKAASILVAVPTQKLRDKNWPNEFKKWKATRIWTKNVQRHCYVSLNKIVGQHFDLVVLDEGHNITEANSVFFKNNTVDRCIVLTATPPDKYGNDTDRAKYDLLQALKLKTVFHYPLDQGVAEGVVADYEIHVVQCYLDDVDKYIKAGTQTNPFYQTEYAAYTYLSNTIKKMMYSKNPSLKFKLLERMHFLKGLRSKTNVAKYMLANVIPQLDKYIVFCGSIAQANELLQGDVFHSEVSDTALVLFCNDKINRLGVVDALNEGHNIDNVDGAMVVQLSSQKRALMQRIGRAVRMRPGHKAKIWILVTIGTQDEKWFEQAVIDLDPSKITYHHYKNLTNPNLLAS